MGKLRLALFGLFLVVATLALRAPFCDDTVWNVDEGITMTAAETIRAGGVLYRDIADQRSPLVPYLKAGVLGVCGDWNVAAVHWTVAVLLGLGALGLWQIGRRLGDGRVGGGAALVYTALCFLLPDPFDAMAAHTEWFLLFFSIAGFWAFAVAFERPGFGRGVGVGALFALAVLCKQPGLLDWLVMLVLVGLLWVVRAGGQRGALLKLGGGAAVGLLVVLGAALGYFAWHGALADLRYYAWSYNNEVYVPAVPLAERLGTMGRPFLLAAEHLPAALVAGLLGAVLLPLVAIRGLCARPARVDLLPWLALGWTASGLVASGLSGRGFSHYSIQVVPGLSLACAWVVVASWDRCRGRGWRWLAVAAVAVAAVDTGVRIGRLWRSLAPMDGEWDAPLAIVRAHTRPSDRVFFWGFAPDCYLHARRLPATRFIYTTFLTGMIPWTNLDPLVDTQDIVTAGAWDQLEADFLRTPPEMIVDIRAARGQGKYPLQEQPALWQRVVREFAEVHAREDGSREFRLYRRLVPATAAGLPPHAVADGTVELALDYTNQIHPLPKLRIAAPAGAERIELFADGRAVRAVAVPDGDGRVAFIVPPEEFAAPEVSFTAVAHYPAGVRRSRPLAVALAAVSWRAQHAPGPTLAFLGESRLPIGSETDLGAPALRQEGGEQWAAHAPARLIYDRPAGLRSVRFGFGLDENVYYDRPDLRASDGVDFVVDYVDQRGTSTRLFHRALRPKTVHGDCGAQAAEVEFPNGGSGRFIVRVSPGPANDAHLDRAYLHAFVATAYGPPLASATGVIPAEAVSAHNEPVMTCDREGRWTAHSPSSLSYEIPVGGRTLVFDYGLEPGSHDGSQGGRTDGIEVVVTATGTDGSATTLFRRWINPAKEPGDHGRQTARIELPKQAGSRVTIGIGPGPHGDFSYDWSYLAALRLE